MKFLLLKRHKIFCLLHIKEEKYGAISHVCLCFDTDKYFSIFCWSDRAYDIFRTILNFPDFFFYTIFYHLLVTFYFLIDNAVNIPCVAVDDCPKVEKPLNMWCMHQYCVYGFIKPYKWIILCVLHNIFTCLNYFKIWFVLYLDFQFKCICMQCALLLLSCVLSH